VSAQRRTVLVLRDHRPGHYNKSEAVATAISHSVPVDIERLDVRPRRGLPLRVWRSAYLRSVLTPHQVLSWLYDLDPNRIAPPDLIVSSGGDTLLANTCLARTLNTANLFHGSLRGLPSSHFTIDLKISGQPRTAPNQVFFIPPNPFVHGPARRLAAQPEPSRNSLGVFIGGPSGSHTYSPDEWQRLIDFIALCGQQGDAPCHVLNSRRTPDDLSSQLLDISRRYDNVTFSDYRGDGRTAIADVFDFADVFFVSEDSNSMIGEAVATCRPVVSFVPKHRNINPKDQRTLDTYYDNGWAIPLAADNLTRDAFWAAARRATPVPFDPMENLATALAQAFRTFRIAPFAVPEATADRARQP